MKINSKSINRNSAKTGTGEMRLAARMLVCLMLTFAMVLPMAMPMEVYAGSSKTRNMAGIHIQFSNKVNNSEDLQMSPSGLQAVGKRKSIRLTWNGVTNPEGIDGYFILRRDLKGKTWRQIAAVDAGTTTYTDKKAKTKNKCYRYSVVAFKKVDGKTMVSQPAGWAGALTTRSKKKNVYSIKVTNLANVSSIMAGSCAQTYLKFPKKSYSKSMRWWSNDNSIATVDSNGLVRGIAPGQAVIYYKTHTGATGCFVTYITKPGTAQAMIDTFTAWMGYSRVNGNQKGIIDIYNSITPWPSGYKMRYGDAWCDATVTAAAIKTGNVERIGRECSVPRHIKIFQSLGIWEEDGTITPKPGDIIVYSWRKFKQPNNASASHIGIVAKVEGGTITAIEGNRGIGVVATREIPVGWGCIRGYGRPNYAN